MNQSESGTSKEDFYDERFEGGWRKVATFGPGHRSCYRWVIKLLDRHDVSPPILDVGAGSGVLLQTIHDEFGWLDLEGSDVSEESRNLIEEKGFPAHEVDLSTQSSLPDRRYQGIVCSEVIEHVEDDAEALRNLYALLEPGGKMVLTTPVHMRYWNPHDEYSGHYRRYDPDRLRRLFEDAGFEVEEFVVWGALVYHLYYLLLMRIPPDDLSSRTDSEPSTWMRLVTSMIYYAFYLDDLLIFLNRGPRCFTVVRKPN